MRAVHAAGALLTAVLLSVGGLAGLADGRGIGPGAVGPGAAPTLHNVTFTSVGHLPSGTSWTVHLAGSVQSTTGVSITFLEANGSYAYTIAGPAGYTPSTPTGSAVVAGSDIAVYVKWITSLYPVTFTESGLPGGTTWHAFLDYNNLLENQSVPIVFRSPNGTFPYTVGADVPWIATPASGFVTVDGTGVNVFVQFTPPPGRYGLTFTEQGLPSGTSWTYSLQGVVREVVSSSATPVLEPNGSYSYVVSPAGAYLPHPGSGTVGVDGANVTVPILFTPAAEFSVGFTETGLAGGNWSVAVAPGTQSLTSPAGGPIQYLLPNGSYTFQAGTATVGWTASPGSGAFIVAGRNVTIPAVAFTGSRVLWSIDFQPNGLGGASWWVAIGSSTWNSSTGEAIEIALADGTYLWTVSGSNGLFPHPPGGTLVVSDGNVTVNIAFFPGAAAPAPSLLGGGTGTDLLIVGAVLGVAVVILLIAVLRSGGGPRPKTPQAASPGAVAGGADEIR